MSNSTVKQYLKEVADNIVCESKIKKFVTNELKQSIASFVEENPALTADDLYKEFGSPKDFAVNFSDREDFPEILKRAKKKSILWKYIGIAGIVLAVIAVICAYFIIKDFSATVYIN